MGNAVLTDIKSDLQAGVIDVEVAFGKVEAWVESQLSGLGAEINSILSQDAQILVADAKEDIQQIITNIQNNTQGLTLNIFSIAFKAAVAELPIIASQGLSIIETDWQLLQVFYASKNNITSTPANNGNLTGGTQTGG